MWFWTLFEESCAISLVGDLLSNLPELSNPSQANVGLLFCPGEGNCSEQSVFTWVPAVHAVLLSYIDWLTGYSWSVGPDNCWSRQGNLTLVEGFRVMKKGVLPIYSLVSPFLVKSF